MLRNYFKIGWRNLMKHKLFSFINIAGLGIAIPFSLLCLTQVVVVFEADNFHPSPGRTYRIITDVKEANSSTTKYATSPFALADNLKTNYPVVENATPVIRGSTWELTSNIKKINVNPIYVEPSFFEIFSFPLEKGTLPELPNTLVITHGMAETFFGTEDPVGKTLTHHDYGVFTVTGVLKPYKRGTHFRSDAMVSMKTFKQFSKDNQKKDLSAFTYVLIKQNSNKKDLDAALSMIATNTNKEITQSKEAFHFRKQLVTDISPAYEKLQNNSYVESYSDIAVNLGMANAIFEHLSSKLPVSRLQRDLTDSTVLRNIGVPFAHTLIAFRSVEKGLAKLILNDGMIHQQLEDNWAVVAEAVQTILRRENYPNPYEALKELTRGNAYIDKKSIHHFIDNLKINNSVKKELKKITPHNYTGVVAKY